MNAQFALDLKVARRKSGLTQQDCAHLLDVNPSRISRLESGRSTPSVQEICTLSLIYGRSFESLFASMFERARKLVHQQLSSLPDCPKAWLGRFNRNHTLNSLPSRLAVSSKNEHGRV
uniref:helix-turn-helix transcriptional regulator n=1 Tax=Pararhizobium sp. IMCC3301 TaxID=3067904 RepID=UPI0035323876